MTKEEHRKYNKIYKRIHQKQIKKYNKIYNQLNKKKRLEYNREYRKNHKEQIRKYLISDKRRKYQNSYNKRRRKININFKLLNNLRNRIWEALKRNIKSKSTVLLLGCSIDLLRNHLESQFKSGMTWNNYGKWHIDHIKPCCQFDLSKASEQKKCFNYTNLQPLWSIDNLKKNKKRNFIIEG